MSDERLERQPPSVTIEESHTLATRWLHWINFPALTVMIWSGLLIYWANDKEHIRIGPWVPVRFFGDGFYDRLNVPRRLAEGIGLHITFAWLFALNGLAYVIYLTVSRSWKHLLPRRGAVRDSLYVVLHDLRLRKTAPDGEGYNAAQRIAYTAIVFMGFGAILSGLAIFKSAQLAPLTALFGGYRLARTIHFYLAVGFVSFFVIHVLQVAKAGWGNFRSMIVGANVIRRPPGDVAPAVAVIAEPIAEG